MQPGSRVIWRGRTGTFVGPRPKGMADVQFDDVEFVERRPQVELMRTNPGLDSSDWSEWAKTDFLNFGYVIENPRFIPEWRKKLATSKFAIPSRRAWPIHDVRHARLALNYIFDRGFGRESDYPRVLRAVMAKWPMTKYPAVWKGYVTKANRLLKDAEPAPRQTAPLKKVANPDYRKLLTTVGPPSQWSGGVAAFLGPERIKALKKLWASMSTAERAAAKKKFSENFRKTFGSPQVRARASQPTATKRAAAATKPTRKTKPYDPSEEQFNAQVQAIYENQVKKKLGKKSTAAFKSGGVRLDEAALKSRKLTKTALRELLKSAFIIATRVGQKHGWLEKGTQKATSKGRSRSMERYMDEKHRKSNRRDYERTLALVRKSGEGRTTVERNVWGKTVVRSYPGARRRANPGEETEALSETKLLTATNVGLASTGQWHGLLVKVLMDFGVEYLRVVSKLPADQRKEKITTILTTYPNTAAHARLLRRASPKTFEALVSRISTTLGSTQTKTALALGDLPVVRDALTRALG